METNVIISGICECGEKVSYVSRTGQINFGRVKCINCIRKIQKEMSGYAQFYS